jgi:hypothetical protein
MGQIYFKCIKICFDVYLLKNRTTLIRTITPERTVSCTFKFNCNALIWRGLGFTSVSPQDIKYKVAENSPYTQTINLRLN